MRFWVAIVVIVIGFAACSGPEDIIVEDVDVNLGSGIVITDSNGDYLGVISVPDDNTIEVCPGDSVEIIQCGG